MIGSTMISFGPPVQKQKKFINLTGSAEGHHDGQEDGALAL